MNKEIKSCPHCGATAWFEPYVDHDNEEDLIGIYIECNGCMCGTRRYSYTEKGEAEAIAAWNKRVIDDELESTKKMLDNAEDEYRQMRDAYFKLHVKYDELVEFIKSMIIPSCGYLLPRLTCDAEELLRKHGVDV